MKIVQHDKRSFSPNVQKVVVHEADKSSGNREQRVEIFLNHIGQFTVPTDTTYIDTETDAADDDQRDLWREYKRNQRAKSKSA